MVSSLLNKIVNHPQTTVIGIALAMAYYIQGYGPSFPSDSNGWGHFVVGLIVTALGVAAADAKITAVNNTVVTPPPAA